MQKSIFNLLAGLCLMLVLGSCKKSASPEATAAFQNVVPAPVSASTDGGAFFLTKDATIGTEGPEGALTGVAAYLTNLLKPATGF
ncbi:MAG: hypothetical protein RL161_66, partial [Bacteroidota bacterium]